MATRPTLLRRLDALEAKRSGAGGVWLITSYADDPQEAAKIEAAERASGAGGSALVVAVRRFTPLEGRFPDNYSAVRL